jgi:hypothetical protein
MLRALKQFAVLLAFLLLTVFSALYFQEDGEGQVTQSDNEASVWVVKIVKKAGGVLSSIAKLSSGVGVKLDSSESEQFASWEEVGAYDFHNSNFVVEGKDLVENFDQKTEQSEFRQFLNDFLKKIPARYLDAKIYSNAWRNIRSLGWLRSEL